MAKQLNVNLSFTADTSQAAAQVRNLQQSLTQLVNQPIGIGQRLSEDMLKATQAAAELKMHLQNATNVDTGTLDFGKLNQSLKASGVTLQQYATQLQSLGPQGQQTFMQLARSVANAEVPLRRSNALLAQFSTTLANTARWQLSSTMLHGFISAVSTAWNYSKDLNESLNNIRIVTGYNIDQMSKFADQANRAAKALSTSTTEYTNASLIYYQQGLSDSEVLSRTETTIKMANASRQSAETVSDQMTAIWNNFYDGSKSLEYYADVVTALGAATASSSEEIAQGLEKFAAVADTVGLSYEYATAALATVTATTRQSADVVGTAFKTLFARLSDLKLGETLEDGTTLGSYSENLAKIGVNIKDASGALKDMDTILNETAAKWDNLDKAQQVALAKGVAGIRQYTQFIALMDNWDFMEENLNTANSSRGTLEEQAKIYEESWEAASKRVKASLETIYGAIMDDEFFIDLTNGFAGLIDKVGGFVKSIGGLQGVLSGLGWILTKVFSEQMTQGFQNLYYNIQMSSEVGRKEMQRLKMERMQDFANSMLNYETSTVTGQTAKQVYSEELVMQQQLAEKADQLTAAEQQKCKFLIEQHRVMGEQSMELAKQLELTKEQVAADRTTLMGEGLNRGKTMTQVTDALNNAKGKANTILEIDQALQNVSKSADISEQQISELNTKLKALGVADADVNELAMALRNAAGDSDKMDVAVEKVRARLSQATQATSRMVAVMLGVDEASPEFEQIANRVARYMQNTQQSTVQNQRWTNSLQNGKDMGEQFSNTLDKMGHKAQTASQLLSTVVSGLMSFGMLVSSITGLVDTLEDPDTTGWEKFGRILTSISMIAMSVMGTFAGMKAAYDLVTSGVVKNTAAKIINAYASHLQEKQSHKTSAAQDIEEKETRETTAEINKNTAAKIANQAADNKMQFKGKNGKIRTYSGKKNHKGQLLDDDGQIISNKYVDKYKLNDFGKTPADGGQAPNKLTKKSLLKPGALKTVGKAVGGAAIIVAAIAAAAFIAKTASDYYNRFEIEAKKAEETAKAVQKTYEEVQSAESEFRSNMDSYESAVDSLDELTKGTEEYKKAVVEANNAAVKLLNTHKNLKYTINEDGLIEIDQASLLAAQRESLQKEARAQAAAMSADQEAKNARLEADKVNFQRTQMKAGGPHWDKDDTTAVAGGVGAGAALAGGAVAYTAIAASNVWNPIGWAMLIAGAVAAVIGIGIAAFNNDADAREAQTLNALEEFSTNNGGRDLTEEEIKTIANQKDSSGKLAESLLKDVDATNEMIAEMRANTEAINRNNELIASQLLQSNDYVMGSENADEIVERSGLFYGNAYEAAIKEVEASGWGKEGISKATGVNDEAKKVWSEYLGYAGLEDKNWQLVDTKGTDENRIFVYLDEQGQRQEKTLAEMQKMKATWMATSQTNANATQLVGYFKEWSEKKAASDQGIAAFLMNGNFEDATKNETEAIQNEIATSFNGDTKAYLESKLGDLGEAAKRLGYDNADALVNAFSAGLTNIDKAWKDIDFNGMSEEVSKNVKISTAQSLENTVKLMNAGQLGEEAGLLFTESLNNMMANVKPEDQEEALRRIAEIDWTQWDAAEQIVVIMRELGYEVDTTSAEWADFVMQMNIANGAMFDHAQALKDIAKMQELINDLSIGDIVSKEDYDMLVSYNDEVERYFRLLGDGTYKVIGDPLDLIQEIGKGIDKGYADAVAGAEANYNAVKFRSKVDQNVSATGFSRDQLGTDTWGVTGQDEKWVQNDVKWYHHVGSWFSGMDMSFDGVTYDMGDPQTPAEVAGGQYEKYDVYGLTDTGLYNAQIDFIDKYLTEYTDEQIKAWKDAANSPQSEEAKKAAAEVSGIVSKYLEMYPTVGDGDVASAEKALQEAKEKQFSAELDYASQAQTSKQLDAMYENKQIGDRAYNSAQLEFVQQEKWEGMDPNEVEEYADALMDAAKNSDLLYDNMSQEAAEDVALYVKKMNQGVKKLQEGFEDWNSILDKSDEGSEEYVEAMNNMKDAMSDVLGVNEDFISDKFILDHLDDIEKAAKGDAKAIDDLAAALGKEIIYDITVDGSSAEKAAIEAHDILQGKLNGKEVGFSVTADMDTEGIISGAQKVIDSAEMTVSEAQAYFNSLGYEPVFKTEEKDVEQRVPITHTKSSIVDVGFDKETGAPYWETATSSWQDGYDTYTGKMDVVAMSSDGKTPQIQELRKKSSGAMNNFSSANKGGKSGGGGGGNSEKTKRTKKSEVVDRYKEVNDLIDDSREAMEKAKREADGLWGAARLKKMREVQAEMKKELKLMRQRREEAAQYLIEDQQALQQAAQDNGVAAFTFDSNGNISNYDEIMNGLWAELEAAEIAAGDTLDDSEKERIQAIKDRIEAVKEAIGIYDATREQVEDWDKEIDEWIRSIQEAYLEELNLELEMKVMIDDSQLSKIEYYLGKVSEDIWGMAESAALMTGQGKDLFNFDLGQADVWVGKFEDFQKRYDDLLYAYTHIDPETGKTFINQEQFVKALTELQNDIYANLNSINELDKTMIGYYGDTLAAAGEELSKFTNLMDHHVAVLDHYSSLLEIMGKSKDWERMKTVLSAQVEVAKNSADVSKANYEMLQRQAEDKKAAWEAAKNNDTLSDYEKSVIEKQWLDAQNAANEAQSKMLEDAQAWAEALKSLLETELEELGENLEKALAGDFGSLDYMMTSMERANSLQEEYLTTTNKIYETNKLMRSAQQEIDKSTNSVAKRRMAQFIEETQQLQNQNKLSQYELEIQQAKYDLLLAEIALEEAQAAKSTVRLQRDSEGNFGYVYTADQNEVANAQQELEDAQNALYNIGLEGANKYAEQYAQTIQEMNDEIRNLTEQWQNGEIASQKEYHDKMLELEDYYGQKLMQFSDLHSKAIMTDSRVANEAWTKNFATMTSKTQLWMQQVDVYVQGVEGSFARYQQGINDVEKYAGMDLDSLAQKTEEIKNDNDALRDSIVDPDNGLIKAMEDEINKVGELALAYAEWRKEIQGAIADQEDLARLIGGDVEKESDDDESNDYKPEQETPTEEPPEETPPEETPPEDTTPSYKKGTLTWKGSGGSRVWTDSAGKTYTAGSAEGKAIQDAFDRAYSRNGGYKGDYWLGWNKLNADVLHEKYGLSTGGYTGDWAGSFGKLAFLHQKELVLNKQDTENLLTAMEFLNRIISAIDLQSMNNSLGGLLSSPSLGRVGDEGGILEQQVHIEASFPGITEHSELEQAFNNLINEAAQYANRK